MKSFVVCLCLGLSISTFAKVRLQDKEPVKVLGTQTRNEVEISILAIERMKIWKDPFSMGDKYEAKEGHEWIVFRIQIKSPKSEVNFKQLEVVDSSDNKVKSLTTELSALSFAGKNIDQSFEVPFLVPKDTQLKSLQVGDFSFELKSISNKTNK